MAERTIEETKFDIGKRLKFFRETAGLTLRQLAKESGVAFTTIQKIESGSISPTVGILLKISRGLKVKMTALIEDEPVARTVHLIRKDERTGVLNQPQTIQVEYIAQNLSDPQMFGFCLSVGPGENSGPEPLIHGGEEMIIGLQGEITFLIEDNEYVVGEGDCLHFKASIPHRWWNRGKKVAKFYFVCSEPRLTPALPDQIS